MWVNYASGNEHSIFSLWEANGTQILIRLISGGTWNFYTSTNNGTASFAANTIASYDKWQHIVATYDGATMLLYFDGVADTNSTAQSGAITSNAVNGLGLFPYQYQSERFFVGRAESAGFWTRALSAAEVKRLYTEPFAGIQMPRRRIVRGGAAAAQVNFIPSRRMIGYYEVNV
jgi:hypothetical protein